MAKKVVQTIKQGLIILAGGHSQRMGRDKAWLPWRGQSLLQVIIERARRAGYRDIILSLGPQGDCIDLPDWIKLAVDITVVHDEKRCGPLGGIAAAFEIGRSDRYGLVAVDMPFLEFEPLLEAESFLDSHDVDAVIMTQADGRPEPLYSVYKKRLLPSVVQAIHNGNYCLQSWLEGICCRYVPLSAESSVTLNVNTPEEYKLAFMRALNQGRKVPIISVVAASRKSGKTSLIVRLTEKLAARGYRVGLVKSDSHGFVMDQEGRDTDQVMRAGAQAVAIAGPHEYALRVRTEKQTSLLTLSQSFSDMDVVFIETRSQGIAPMLEVYLPGSTEGQVGREADTLARIDMSQFDDEALDDLLESIVIPCFS